MKICPICNQSYPDDNLNYCLNDGGVLQSQGDDAPPTMIMNQAKTTNPNWSNYQPPTYQNQQLTPHQPWGMQGQAQFPMRGRDQTLPTISMVLGILGFFFMCCYGGIPFGLIAIILGYLGIKNVSNDPQQYGGKEMAIAGMILGGLALLVSLLLIFLGILGNISR